jgi:hypothetical protein
MPHLLARIYHHLMPNSMPIDTGLTFLAVLAEGQGPELRGVLNRQVASL